MCHQGLPSKGIWMQKKKNNLSKPWYVWLGFMFSEIDADTHTHMHHLVIAYLYATMLFVMNAAQAFKLSALPLFQLGCLFNQRVIFIQAEWDGDGRYCVYAFCFHFY